MEQKNDKVLYGVMSILFNSVGVPQFMRGKSGEGVKHIILSIVTCGICGVIYEVKGIIQGIKTFQMSDEEYLAAKAADIANAPKVDPNASFAEKASAVVGDTVGSVMTDVKGVAEVVDKDVADKINVDAIKDKASDITEKVADKAEDITDKVSDKVGDVVDDIKDKASDVKEDAGEKVEDIKEDIADKAEDVKEAVEDKVEDIKDKVDGE